LNFREPAEVRIENWLDNQPSSSSVEYKEENLIQVVISVQIRVNI